MQNIEQPLIATAGAAMVDIYLAAAGLQLQELMTQLGLTPGGQTLINQEQLNSVFPQYYAAHLERQELSNVQPAGTYLNFFTALSKEQRRRSTLVTTSAVTEEGEPTWLAQMYHQRVKELEITHVEQKIPDGTAVCLTMNPKDRAMATYLGAADQLNHWPKDLKPEYLYVEGYESTSPGSPIYDLTQDLIWNRCETSKILMSLSADFVAGREKTRELIDKLKDTKRLACLFGNETEYKALLQIGDEELTADTLKPHLEFFKNMDYALITLGARGMIAVHKGEVYFCAATQLENTNISTTGAGDASAGAFTSAILEGKTVTEALQHAVEKATEVITSKREP
jgi:sugar/nucleoside kinase (ribokinase family)